MTIDKFLYKSISNYNYDDETVSVSETSSLFCELDVFNTKTTFSFQKENFDLLYDYKNYLTSGLEENKNFIQPGLKYLSTNYLVYERPPSHKLVNCYLDNLHNIDPDNTPSVSYYLPIPWQLYIVGFDNLSKRIHTVRMYFMNSPLYSSDQTLYLPYIPNFYSNGSLCRPFFSSMEDIERYSQDVSGMIEASYDWVWSSNFNLDLTESISQIYSQNRPSIVSRNIRTLEYINYRVSPHVIKDTYSQIEKLSLSDVSSLEWTNPSLLNHYTSDDENVDTDSLVEDFCAAHSISYDPDDFENYEEFVDYILNETSFYSEYPKSINRKKTFSEILNIFKIENNSNSLQDKSFEKYLLTLS